MPGTKRQISDKAALRGEPSYVWRAGQERRLAMIRAASGDLLTGRILVAGCGVGSYLTRLAKDAGVAIGLDIEFERVVDAHQKTKHVVCGNGEQLPLPENCFDFVLSHEVIEHIGNDRAALEEIFRVLKPGGRLALFCPNRGYPFETHGIFWRGKYRFGNIPFINYLPRTWRDRLAPHVHIYSRKDLDLLLSGFPVKVLERRVIFGAYDNIIERYPRWGFLLRKTLQALEKTPFQGLGLSHFWVVEKIR